MNRLRPFKSPIPEEFLLLIGACDVTIHGVKVTTHLANCVKAVDKHIADLRSYLECNTKVVGLDVKNLNHGHNNKQAIILCVFRRCIIIHFDYLVNPSCKVPVSLDNFLQDPKICFVGVTELPKMRYILEFSNNVTNVGVKVGDLGARILRKPALIGANLADIAHQVGVSYDGPESATAEIEMDKRNPMVFTDQHVVAAISDAYAYLSNWLQAFDYLLNQHYYYLLN
ncbi:Ephrin type-A receptor 3 [Bienertia sinuspersici]